MEKAPKTPYRDPKIRTAIRNAPEYILEGKEISPETTADFFGLKDERLTEKEIQRFALFVDYSLKRIVNHRVVDALLLEEDVSPEKQSDLGAKKVIELAVGRDMKTLVFHDTAHCVTTLAHKSPRNSIIPAFMKEPNQVNNKEVIQDESLALMWGNVFGKYPLFIYFLKAEYKEEFIEAYMKKFPSELRKENGEVGVFFQHITSIVEDIDYSSFESIFRAYQLVVYATTRKVNEGVFLRKQKTFDPGEMYKMNEEYDTVAEDLINNPDPVLVNLARSVYDNYDKNHKILYDEFEKICGPLLDRLEKRKNK